MAASLDTLDSVDFMLGSDFVAPNLGNITLNPSSANIGSVSILGGTINSLATMLGGRANVTLNSSNQFIGLVTTVPTYISGWTKSSFVISAAAVATLIVPPSGQKIFIKSLLAGTQGRTEVSFWKANGSATVRLSPPISLATTGGYVEYFGDNGSEWGVADDALTAVLNGAATVGVGLNVRFAA